jgi:hypothetical protein
MDIKYMRAVWASRRDPYHVMDLDADPVTNTISYGNGAVVLTSRPLHLSLCKRFTAIHRDEINPKTGLHYMEEHKEIYDGVPEDMMVCGHCLKSLKKLQG